MPPTTGLPNIAEVVARILQRVPREERPLLLALSERRAAERYRGWAGEVAAPDRKAGLLACAEREEEIGRRVEALYPEAASIQRDILSRNPDLPDISRSLFAGYPLDQQLVIQARGERLGAGTWRAFAQDEKTDEVRQTFLGCALLEEESAAFLDSIAGGPDGSCETNG